VRNTLLLSILSFLSIGLVAQITPSNDYVTVVGKLLSARDTSVIGQAHIVCLETNKGTVSDFEGDFKLTVKRDDNIIVSAIGYKWDTLKTSNLASVNHLTFFLKPKIYQLGEVQVYPFSNNPLEFKQHFLALNIENNQFDSAIKLPNNRKVGKITAPTVGFGLAFTSPITWLYNMFSKEANAKREYIRLLKEDEYRAKLAIKYNKEIIAQLTGLVDDDEIKAFMEFCQLPDPFIEENQMYEILEAVQLCFAEYQK